MASVMSFVTIFSAYWFGPPLMLGHLCWASRSTQAFRQAQGERNLKLPLRGGKPSSPSPEAIGLGVFTERCLRSENAKPYEIASSYCATRFMPLVGHKTRVAGRLGRRSYERGRVKFLPLAWAGMPKTSFRKNSDSLNKAESIV